MIIVWFLAWAPLGVLTGWLLARLETSWPVLRSWMVALPLALAISGVLAIAVNFAAAALDYSGDCSGWSQKGSTPCSLVEFALLDYEITLLFAAIAGVAAAAVAMAARARFRHRS